MIEQLVLYRQLEYGDIMRDLYEAILLSDSVGKIDDVCEKCEKLVYGAASRLIELAGRFGFKGNIWQNYLTLLLVSSENAFSRACEMRGIENGTLRALAIHDFMIFRNMFIWDFRELFKVMDLDVVEVLLDYERVEGAGETFNRRIRDRICELSDQLAQSRSIDEFADHVIEFYKRFGVGKFGLHKAFRIEHDDRGVHVVPITNIAHVRLDDIVGYESAKKQLTENTEAFLKGKRANNCLLFGDAGTGKSSSIKAILNKYYEDGLRIIEIYKHQFQDINSVIAQIKNRNYKFILYMDDLSFEDFETEYKYLKAVIEGGLEKKPQNVLIYATSNRRHLIRENFSDRDDAYHDVHKSDTVQEKLSLAARFGVTIYFGSPDKKQFQEIVRELARRDELDMDEAQLLAEANRWELSHGGFSGRTARQFVDHLLGTRQ